MSVPIPKTSNRQGNALTGTQSSREKNVLILVNKTKNKKKIDK